jgi:hypothetical protein
MKVLCLRKNAFYNDWDVANVLSSEFCAGQGWTPGNFYKPQLENGVEMNVAVGDGDTTEPGGIYDGEAFYHEAPLSRIKKDKLQEIAAARYEVETGGAAVNGMAIDTSRESQALITGAALAATLDANYICRWKTGAGFVTLDAATIIAAAQAVRAHVQEAFNREAELIALLESAETVEQVAAIEW